MRGYTKGIKYKQYFEKMLEENEVLFTEFENWHRLYQKRQLSQEEYNQKGAMVMKVIKEWETRLCAHMESGQYGTYSAKLAEKFWEEVRKKFPLIDFVGVKIEKVAP